ncbi:MAG: WYL domain-containing protein [Microthrixaceae bacterium]|nr:WYL domain-containing protein [Microthrixaceae bacterium]
MDKFTRLLNLIALLQQAGVALTFAEIRERLADEAYPQHDPESARRGFERDKADLLAMGVRLESEPILDDPSVTAYTIATGRTAGAGRGHGSLSGVVSDPGFTPGELAALRFAATAVALRGEAVDSVTDASDGLRKYGGMGTPPAERTVADLRLDDNVADLFAAVLDSAPVGFTYARRTRRVLPLQLANRSGHWYLRSQDLDVGESRTYRLDRFESPVLRLPPVETAGLALTPGSSGVDGDEVSHGIAEAQAVGVRYLRACARTGRDGHPGGGGGNRW